MQSELSLRQSVCLFFLYIREACESFNYDKDHQVKLVLRVSLCLCVFVPLYIANVPSWIEHKESCWECDQRTSQCGTAECGIRGKQE